MHNISIKQVRTMTYLRILPLLLLSAMVCLNGAASEEPSRSAREACAKVQGDNVSFSMYAIYESITQHLMKYKSQN